MHNRAQQVQGRIRGIEILFRRWPSFLPLPLLGDQVADPDGRFAGLLIRTAKKEKNEAAAILVPPRVNVITPMCIANGVQSVTTRTACVRFFRFGLSARGPFSR